MRIALAALLLLAVAPGCAAKPAAAPASRHLVDQRFDALVDAARLPFAGMIVLDTAGPFYARTTPGFDSATPVPVASASKWIAAALIMTAVDRGELRLDTTVGSRIPEAPAGLQAATLQQLLSHTSGMDGAAMFAMPPVQTLEASVMQLFATPVARPPGTAFAYGGASMQIAGLMLERATRQPFQQLFADRIAIPLGMTGARFGSPPSWGRNGLPWVGGGMTISLRDYGHFLRMLLNDGISDGQRILSADSIARMERDLLIGMPIVSRPAAVGEAGYGLGLWCERSTVDGSCSRISSAGAFGTYPWLDRQAGRAGIFMTRATLSTVVPAVHGLRDAAVALQR